MAQNPQHHGPWRKIFQNEQTNAIRSCFVVLMVMKNNDKRSFQVLLFGTPLEAFGSCLSGVLVGTRPVFPIETSILKKEGCHTQKKGCPRFYSSIFSIPEQKVHEVPMILFGSNAKNQMNTKFDIDQKHPLVWWNSHFHESWFKIIQLKRPL